VSKICVAGCRSSDDATVFPDVDWPVLARALADRGVGAELWAWEDDETNWDAFDLVVVRSTWTSVDEPEAFLRWVAAVSSMTALENPADVIAWNIDKQYLEDLRSAGVPIVPTQWIRPGDRCDQTPMPVVVKPSVSAGGRDTALHATDPKAAAAHVHRLQAAGRTVMVQPYVESIAEAGETRMVFIDGVFSHALQVGALLEPDQGVLEKPWEKPVETTPVVPTATELEVARGAMAHVKCRFGTPLYGRVDTIDLADEPEVLELELIDPSLSLWASPASASALAAAIVRRLG
jgi:glutathione synthase/RimK-type ligase-like ATP-grasp enzyme